MKTIRISCKIFAVIVLSLILCGCTDRNNGHYADPDAADGTFAGKKVLHVNSYHPEYAQSMIIDKTVRKLLSKEGIEVKTIFFDAKYNQSDLFLRQKAVDAKKRIESWQPDVVIVADDPANEYLVVPYYRNDDMPFVFVGVNWDAEKYGYPCTNVTGQIEVEFIDEVIEELKKYAHGNKVNILTGDTLTDRNVCSYYQDVLKIGFDRVVFVRTFDEWKREYLALQDTSDILIFRNNAGIIGWDDHQAYEYILQNTRIATGSITPNIAPYVLIDYSKVIVEFGEFAAETTLQILSGVSPADIPVSHNKQLEVYLNMKLAQKLGIVFPMQLIEQATFVEQSEWYEDKH